MTADTQDPFAPGMPPPLAGPLPGARASAGPLLVVPTGAPVARWDPLRATMCVVLLAYVWRVQDLFPIVATLKVPVLASLAAIGLFLADAAAMRASPRFRHPVVKLAAAILVLMILSVPTSLYQGLSFRFVFDDHIKTFLMMMLLAASVRALVDVRRYVLVTVLGAGLYSWFVLTRFEIGMGGRLGSLLYYDANDLGLLLVCTLPLALYLLRGSPSLAVRGLSAAAALAFLITIVRTGSRGAFLGLLAVVLYLLLTLKAVPALARVAWLTGLAVFFMMAASESYWTSMRTLLTPSADYNWSGQSDGGRIEVWKRGIRYMLRRPLTGVGVAAFPVAEGTISPLAPRQEYGIGLKWSAAHNSFVQIGAELGVGGLICFVGLLAAAWRALRRVERGAGSGASREAALAQAFRTSLVGYVVAGFFLSQAYAAYLYTMLGIIVGFSSVIANSSEGARAAAVSVGRGHRRST